MINRPQRLYFFLVVWFTMISLVNGSAQNLAALRSDKDFARLAFPGKSFQLGGSSGVMKGVDHTSGAVLKQPINSERKFSVPSNIYYIQSGVICKMEWALEKSSHIPFRFRLGSLADCNAMEGKR
jgi:hypothetical protein